MAPDAARPVVCVVGGGRVDAATEQAAEALGAAIAREGWVLLNGGRDAGVMAASARGAREAGGLVVGILPDRDRRRASRDLDVAVCTGLGHGRNLANVLSSDVVVALSGGAGTLSEIAFAVLESRPCILLGRSVPDELAGDVQRADSVEDAVAWLRRVLAEAAP